jgi:hypothetical protein
VKLKIARAKFAQEVLMHFTMLVLTLILVFGTASMMVNDPSGSTKHMKLCLTKLSESRKNKI